MAESLEHIEEESQKEYKLAPLDFIIYLTLL